MRNMNNSVNKILLLILVACGLTSVVCCPREPCPVDGVKNQHDRQPHSIIQDETSTKSQHEQVQQENNGSHHTPPPSSATITTTNTPATMNLSEVVRDSPGATTPSIVLKDFTKSENIRGEERRKRHVHVDLGYGQDYHHHHHVPLFGFHDLHYDDYHDHHHHGHHHHRGHHHHHH